MIMKRIGLYEVSILLFFLVVPIVGTVIEANLFYSGRDLFPLLFKWYVFSGVGLRLFSAGLKQAISPSFTAKTLFNLDDEKAFAIVRELGFANVCFGIIGILSFFFPELRVAAAIAGGTFFGLAGFAHLFRKRESKDETFALVSDLFIFIVLFVLGVLSYL
jgi:hypothetical protein